MPVYKKRKIEGKDMRVTVRLSADEVSTLDHMVKQVGAGSRSELMRVMMNQYLLGQTVDPVSQTNVQTIDVDRLQQICDTINAWQHVCDALTREVNSIGVNVNQLAKAVNSNHGELSHGVLLNTMSRRIADILQQVQQMRDAVVQVADDGGLVQA